MKRLAALLLAAFLLGPVPAHSVQPDEMLSDPVLEERAREIGNQLRCLVCQNQSIEDSNADLARDLRILVRERLKAGDTNEEVMAFMQARYGDFVLLEPPVKPTTWLLWFGPAILAFVGLGGVAVFFRRRRRQSEEAPLSGSERKRIEAVLGETPTDRAS